MSNALHELIKMLDAFRRVKTSHAETYLLVSGIRDRLKGKCEYTLEDAVNFVYVMREIIRYSEDTRREVDAVRELLEKWGCAKYVAEHVNDPSGTEPIRASLATGTPKIDLRTKMPKLKDDPDAYYALMKHLGVKKTDAEKGIVRPYWPEIQKYVSDLAAQGKPLPPGCKTDSSYAAYSMVIKAVHDLGEFVEEMAERSYKAGENAENEVQQQMLVERSKLQRESDEPNDYE